MAEIVKLAKIVKFGGNYEIWSTPISLVWMSLIHNNELMVRLGTFVIVIVFVFIVVFLLVRSCFLITLIKYLKGHMCLECLCVFQNQEVCKVTQSVTMSRIELSSNCVWSPDSGQLKIFQGLKHFIFSGTITCCFENHSCEKGWNWISKQTNK